ncbi:NAD(P)H-binding protein [uncultured Rhodoblastus sp.]|uniref:NmrA family NAD(P)-binding protein n=1 Tax=uncultured Rhodoblastus sp. TaxID=543037 RepID=UPI0025F7D12E|nr:NAD(P)H-binding protein [uncultured Rhodoblastus sp.]
MLLITGASGNAGGAVLDAALRNGSPVRAMYRSERDAGRGPTGDPAIADFSDKASLSRALEGIDRVYLVCGPIPQLVEYEINMIDACKATGVRHIVLNSAMGAGRFTKSFPSWHARVEDYLRGTGLDYTILRPNGFMQNIVTYDAASIRASGAFYAAMGDTRTSLIDVRDVGEIAAGILGDPRPHLAKTYELYGPEAVSNAEIAARISAVLGTPVSFVDIPEDAQRQSMLGIGMPEWQVTAILELQEYYRTGSCAAIDSVVAGLLGKPARALDAYLRENAAAFRRDPA